MSDKPMEEFIPVIKAKKFVNETVVLDGTHYADCEFDHCALIYRGGYYGLTDCVYRYPTWRFEEAANRTVELIRRIAETEPDFQTWLFRKRQPPGQSVQ